MPWPVGLSRRLDRAAAAHVNPGTPASLHRLNRAEYANAVRDLLAVEVDAEAMLPPDEQAFGFDTNAEALTMAAGAAGSIRVGGARRSRARR